MGIKLNVDPKELRQLPIPKGVYTAHVRELTMDEVPPDRAKSDFAHPGDPQLNWMFQIDDPEHPELKGRTVFERTIIAPGRGEQFLRFMRGFDQDIEAVGKLLATEGALDDLVKRTPVKIEVVHRANKDDPTRPYVNVKSVAAVG